MIQSENDGRLLWKAAKRKVFGDAVPNEGLKGHCIEFKYYADGIHLEEFHPRE